MVFFFHGRDLGVAEFIVDVVVRIVTFFGVVFTVTIGIVEGSQIVGNAFRVVVGTRGGPILDDGRNLITIFQFGLTARVVNIGEELIHFGAGDLEDLIPFGASLRGDGCSTINGQRTSVVVVTDLTETQGSALQLVIDVDTSNPQGASEQGGSRAIGGDEVLGASASRQVPPHITTRIDTCSNVVDVEPVV
ncbi:MAG: hypothetical protein F082_1424 [bacterium F082]|nr:MAG: hypothetical protein F082_1424 [bacterium F082]